jgi:hypothetical protein
MVKNAGDNVRVIEKWDVVARVESMLRSFCPLLNCIQSACPSHSMHPVRRSSLYQPPSVAHDRKLKRDVEPTLNNASLRQLIKESCNNMCFTLENDEYIVRVTGGK